MLYAHSLPDQPVSLWQSLEQHLRKSAQRAETFGRAFGAGYDPKLGLLVDDPTRQTPEDCLF